jgi:hypothetical protein
MITLKSDTPPLWMSDQPDAETSTLADNTKHSQETNIHGPGGIRTHNPSKRGAANPRLRSRGRWDRPVLDTKLIQMSVSNKSNKSRKVM